MKPFSLILLLLFSTSAFAEQPLKGRELDKYIAETEAKCEAAREEKLKEAREKKIQECIDTNEKSPDECKKFYSDYGLGKSNKAGVKYGAGMFDNIPECLEAENARAMKGTER